MQVSPGKSGSKTIAHQNDVVNDPLESVRRKAEKAFKVLSKRNSHASIKAPRDSSCAATPISQSTSSSGIKFFVPDQKYYGKYYVVFSPYSGKVRVIEILSNTRMF